jgi:hypothetical protein
LGCMPTTWEVGTLIRRLPVISNRGSNSEAAKLIFACFIGVC